MDAKPNTFADTAELRRRAEVLLKKQQQKKKKAEPRTEAETQRLLHELQVHQIELEMQNAELQDARDDVEAGLVKYTDLYDFAPVGYFSIDERGRILEVNLTGATLLGVERSRLVKRSLSRFVAAKNRPAFQMFLETVFAGPAKQVCEAQLIKDDGTSFWADLQAEPVAFTSDTRKSCRLAVSDITPLKRAEEAQARLEALAAANQELTQEIVRREAVEEALRKSEQQSSQLLSHALHLQEQLRHLSHQILQTQEEERKRISRELHDEIVQTLTGVNVHLATLKNEAMVDPEGISRKIARTQRLVEKSVDIVHRFARDLRPMLLDDLGLIPALRSYMGDVMKRTGLRTHLISFTAGRVEELDNDRRTVLYRVGQEAITNVVRHAQASLVEVRIERLKDAIGICMRERVEMVGGTFSIESEPGHGTSIRVEIPFSDDIRGKSL
jgi:PAS domain S-box-containing protein